MCVITLGDAKFKYKQRIDCWIGILIAFNLFMYYIYYHNNSNFINSASRNLEKNRTIFLIRTYYGHLDSKNPFNLKFTLNSLKSLQNPNWIALLLCTDSEPINFENYAEHDSRILTYPRHEKTPYDEWTAGYDITDSALDYLENNNFSANFIVITNGDNYYSPQFLNELPSPNNVDIVAVDYWSRYERAGYDLQPLNMNSTICHKAMIRVGLVDLGGVLLNYQRLQR